MVIAVSGTPGTGKSVFARALAKNLKARVIDLNALIAERKIYTLDPDGTKVADIQKMRLEFSRAVRAFRGMIVVEGLLAHLLQKKLLTHVVVLRTRPRVLERRLRARGYSKAKTRENVEAEALDIILWEAVRAHGINKVYEIDATRLKPSSAARLFLSALAGKVSLKPGKVSWLEEVF
ncbi:MAG: adenylate kinase family protein [Hadesarchaea archaeon]|nr:adenylate kinase family protein [Hadesarchaea archaeon]